MNNIFPHIGLVTMIVHHLNIIPEKQRLLKHGIQGQMTAMAKPEWLVLYIEKEW